MDTTGTKEWKYPGPRPVLEGFLRALSTERNARKARLFLTPDAYSAGPDGTAAFSRQELQDRLEERFNREPSPVSYRILDYREKSETENCRGCLCRICYPDMDVSVPAVVSVFFRKEQGAWRIRTLHSSRTAHAGRKDRGPKNGFGSSCHDPPAEAERTAGVCSGHLFRCSLRRHRKPGDALGKALRVAGETFRHTGGYKIA